MRQGTPSAPGAGRETFSYLIAWRTDAPDEQLITGVPRCPSSLSGRANEAEISSHVQACIDMFVRGQAQVLSIVISRVPIAVPNARRSPDSGPRRRRTAAESPGPSANE